MSYDYADLGDHDYSQLDDALREDARKQAEEEQHERLIEAIREALTKGVSMANIRWLCHGCGVSYADVIS